MFINLQLISHLKSNDDDDDDDVYPKKKNKSLTLKYFYSRIKIHHL